MKLISTTGAILLTSRAISSRRRTALVVMAGLAAASGAARAQSPAPETMDRAKRATVLVFTHSSKSSYMDTKHGSGSGFFINSTGLMLTNDHVTNIAHAQGDEGKYNRQYLVGRTGWTIIVNSGTDEEHEYEARFINATDAGDMCILQVFDESGEKLETPDYYHFRPSSGLSTGTNLWCLGFPGGDNRKKEGREHSEVAISKGTIIALPRSPSGRLTKIQTDVEANPGNSGGPMMDIDGRMVGIATQVGGWIAGRLNVTDLVPADLSKQLIEQAFHQGLVESSTDITPFYQLFVDAERIWNFPMADRSADADCVVLEDDSRYCGLAVDESQKWPSPLGEIEVPTRAMAYVHSFGESATAFIDGGDRFLITPDEASFKLRMSDGTETTFDLEDVEWITFRKPQTRPETPPPAYVIGGDYYHLSLLDVRGDVAFKPSIGDEVKVKADMVSRVGETELDDLLYTTAGSRLAGTFEDHELSGKLAWTGTPVTFSFSEVHDAEIATVDFNRLPSSREPDLVTTLATSDRRIVAAAELLEHGDLAGADKELKKLLEPDSFRALPPAKQDHIRCLHGEWLLRSGKFAEARDVYRRLKAVNTAEVSTVAIAREAILERYPDGVFRDGSIADPVQFRVAASELADEFTLDAKRTLEQLMGGTPSSRKDYQKLVKVSEKAEEHLLVASRYSGSSADPYLYRLWQALIDWHQAEDQRLQQEQGELREEFDRARADQTKRMTRVQERQFEDRISRVDRQREELRESVEQLREKVRRIGFIIDDPNFYKPGDAD